MFSVCTGVGGSLYPIYSSVCRDVTASRKLVSRAPSSASTPEDMTVLIICAIARTVPLLAGFAALSKLPPDLLRALVSEIYYLLLCKARIILLARNVTMSSGSVAA